MALRFVLDEHLRGRPYLSILRQNTRGGPSIDVVQVGDPVDLPRGTQDPDLIRWAAKQSRIIIARDKATLPKHLLARVEIRQAYSWCGTLSGNWL
jgi:hypothetical protein